MAVIQEQRRGAAVSTFGNIRDWRIGRKLLIAFLVATMVPLVLSGVLSIRASREALLNQGIINLNARSVSTSSTIDRFLDTYKEETVPFMTMPQFTAFVANPADAVTKANALKIIRALASRKYYEAVFIANTAGIVILSSTDRETATSIAARDYFQAALKGANHISDPWIVKGTSQPSIFFSAPIMDSGGNILGALITQVSLNGIGDFVEKDSDSVGAGTVGILLDENGIRIADGVSLKNRAAADKLLYTSIAPLADATVDQLVAEQRFGASVETFAVTPLPEVAAALARPDNQSFESTGENSPVRHYAAITSITSKPWHYVLMTPLPTFTGAADNLAIQFVVLIVIVAVITIVAVTYIARGFTRPIVHLTQVADRISMGELDTQIDMDRRDEIGQLAEAIGRMQASLQATMERLRARRTST